MTDVRQITDTGKIWVKGSFGPSHGVLIGETVVLTGLENDQTFDGFVEEDSLILDIHDAGNNLRIVRKISLKQEPNVPGTLFSGFENTKHRDVLAINFKDATEEEWQQSGEDYSETKDMNCRDFWDYLKQKND